MDVEVQQDTSAVGGGLIGFFRQPGAHAMKEPPEAWGLLKNPGYQLVVVKVWLHRDELSSLADSRPKAA